MKLFAPCEVCDKWSFFIRKRKIVIAPVAKPVTSKKQMCSTCYTKVLAALKK